MKHFVVVLVMGVRNLIRSGRRTVSVLTAIVVGLVGLTMLDGFITFSMNGFRDAIIKSGTGDIQVAGGPSYFDQGDSNPFPFMMKDAAGIESQLRRIPEVKEVLPSLSFTAVMSSGAKSATVSVHALPVLQAKKELSARTIVEGRDLVPGESGSILVGKGVAARLGLAYGDTVSLYALQSGGGLNTESYTVAGVTSSAIAALDSVAVSMSLKDAQSLLGTSTVPDLIVFLHSPADAERVMRAIADEPASSPLSGLAERTWEELSPDFQQGNLFYQMILGVARLIVLIVALLSISGSLSISVVERYREIGTLRAFGTRSEQLLIMLLVEGVVLGVCGSVAGSVAGEGLAAIVNASGGVLMKAEPGMSVASLRVLFTPEVNHFLANSGWIVLASAAGAVVPWFRSTRLSISELLRSRQ